MTVKASDDFIVSRMLKCIENVERYTNEGKRDFLENAMLQHATIWQLQGVAYLSTRISPEVKKQFPTIAWMKLEELYRLLSEDYLDYDLHKIWHVIHDDIPELKPQVMDMEIALRGIQ